MYSQHLIYTELNLHSLVASSVIFHQIFMLNYTMFAKTSCSMLYSQFQNLSKPIDKSN